VEVGVLVGTRKGLFLLRGDEGRRRFAVAGPLLPGWEVFHATVDPRDGTLYACTSTFAYGPTVHRSQDGGATWQRAEEIGLPAESGLTLERTWYLLPGPESRPGELWLGAAPGALLFARRTAAVPSRRFPPCSTTPPGRAGSRAGAASAATPSSSIPATRTP
jgi:hypothetical protein